MIVPAYNEEARLPAMLDECTKFLKEREEKDKGFTFEVRSCSDASNNS